MTIKKYTFIIFAVLMFFAPTTGLQAQTDTNYQFTRNLTIGSVGEDVRQLQIYLNGNNFLLAPIHGGAGSPGSETTYFGERSRTALANWQVANNIYPPAGYFGPISRARINSTQAVLPPITETPETKPIEVPEEATLPPSFDNRVDNQVSSGLDYDLTLLERSIHTLINEERKKFGVGELTWDVSIADVARAHSDDQAADNGALTNPDLLCHYPLIRHEGIRGEYGLADRLRVGGVGYRSAGENIVMFSTAKNLLYTYKADNPPPDCIEVPTYKPVGGTKEERLALFQDILSQSLKAVEGLEKVNWVNHEWLTYEEIGARAVNLWMNSPGHRDNLLRAGFNFAGVGIIKVNNYLIITQNFVGR